jgi:hypothetical protein
MPGLDRGSDAHLDTRSPEHGLTSAKNIMSAAHLASLNAARSGLSKLLPESLLQAFVSTLNVRSTLT